MNKKQISYCYHCKTEFNLSDLILFEDEFYCDDCLEFITTICDDCCERIATNDAITDESHCLCQGCYESNYSTCEECGAIIYNNDCNNLDNYTFCNDCYQKELEKKPIHSYDYKPMLIFYGYNKYNRFFGIELEVDLGEGNHFSCDDEKEEDAIEILKIANNSSEKYIYIKNDCSLSNGFEIVSHPMTLEYHKENFKWQEIMQKLISIGYKSHKTNTCGLHCHINRSTFGPTTDIQEEVIARIIYFVEHHWSEMLRFSRRTEYQMRKWANRYGMKAKPYEFIEDLKYRNKDRYSCVNTCNEDTLEFRLFKGTLKYNTFIAALQLVNRICDIAISMSDERIADLSWHDFVGELDCEKYKELITYLKECRLYINESTEIEEEEK